MAFFSISATLHDKSSHYPQFTVSFIMELIKLQKFPKTEVWLITTKQGISLSNLKSKQIHSYMLCICLLYIAVLSWHFIIFFIPEITFLKIFSYVVIVYFVEGKRRYIRKKKNQARPCKKSIINYLKTVENQNTKSY